MYKDELAYWLAALHLPAVAPNKFLRWVNHFHGIRALFMAGKAAWQAMGMSANFIAGLEKPAWDKVEKTLRWSETPDHHLLPIHHADYPPLLKEIANPPLLLFVCGNKSALTARQLAMVGGRQASPYGLTQAERFAYELAQAGLAITSGLAAGIDQASHRGVLAAKGVTLGVMGTGLNVIYPASSRPLVDAILASNGAVLSEFVLDTKPNPYHFPQRNRIISGLSLGVFVVEAAIKSGSLITAKHAADQGREVFAMPGAITHAYSRGCHYLIRQGAALVESAADILETLCPYFKNPQVAGKGEGEEKYKELSSRCKEFLQQVGYEMTPIDMIVLRSGLTASEVSSMLLNLELQGHVRAVTGGYIRTT